MDFSIVCPHLCCRNHLRSHLKFTLARAGNDKTWPSQLLLACKLLGLRSWEKKKTHAKTVPRDRRDSRTHACSTSGGAICPTSEYEYADKDQRSMGRNMTQSPNVKQISELRPAHRLVEQRRQPLNTNALLPAFLTSPLCMSNMSEKLRYN